MNLKPSHWIYLLAGASSIALAGGVISLSTQPVHADARLPKPATAALQIQNATPASLAPPNKAVSEVRTDKLSGIASWYGSVFDGRRTASGERFDMNAMTACHPTLPFGTLVRVIDQNTKKSVVVRINDRGDLEEGRVIDLSYAAAEKLHILKAGLAPVSVEVISETQLHHKK